MKNKRPLRQSAQEDFAEDVLSKTDAVASNTECTGLMPTPAEDYGEAESYNELYVVPKVINNGKLPTE